MERACDTPLRDMLDQVALDLKNNYVSEVGTKQSFNYDVSIEFIRKWGLFTTNNIAVNQSFT